MLDDLYYYFMIRTDSVDDLFVFIRCGCMQWEHSVAQI